MGDAHLPESDAPARPSFLNFDKNNPIAKLFHARKKKGEGIMNGISTDKLVLEEAPTVVDKRMSGIINDKAGLVHFQRTLSLTRNPSMGNSPLKLRNMLKKHSLKKASFEFQSLLKKLRTHHNKPTVLSKYFVSN